MALRARQRPSRCRCVWRWKCSLAALLVLVFFFHSSYRLHSRSVASLLDLSEKTVLDFLAVSSSTGHSTIEPLKGQQERPKQLQVEDPRPRPMLLEQKTYSYETSLPSPIAIFFNIFVPSTKDGKRNSYRIVRAQIKQLKQSTAARRNVTVYYQTLGQQGVITPKLMKDFCGDIPCLPVDDHHKEGFEVLTLRHVHQYCTRHPTSRVIYMHNKGSHHQHDLNENWRPALTYAVLDECIKRKSTDCNLCGLIFYTQWTTFYPGNFFDADCSYIRQLIPPLEFEARMDEVVSKIVLMRLRGQLLTNLHTDRKDRFGLDRYSDEHWVASHPDVKVCDTATTGTIVHYLGLKHKETYKLQRLGSAPRAAGSPDSFNVTSVQLRVEADKALRIREYYFLAGNLLKWWGLYGKSPPQDSWVWKWFPDGKKWKKAVRKHGRNAVDIMTKPYMSNHLPLEPTFSIRTTPKRKLAVTGPTVFFDVYVAPESDAVVELAAVKSQLNVLASGAKKPLTVLLTTAGNSALADADLCSASAHFVCHKLGHYDQRHRGETLSQIHDFCADNPSKQVAYIHNVAPMEVPTDGRHKLVQQLSSAAVSNECFNALEEQAGSCTMCGLIFSAIPAHMMASGMFSTKCSYVNRLLSPWSYEARMEEVISRTIILKLWGKLSFAILEPRPDRLGLDAWAMDHWIGSHPSMIPCDLTTKSLGVWMQDGQKEPFRLMTGGARRLQSPLDFNATQEAFVRGNESFRIREYHLLAGNILKWGMLYGEVPDRSSWVWQFYPDGDRWYSAVGVNGSLGAVDAVTGPFVDSGGVA